MKQQLRNSATKTGYTEAGLFGVKDLKTNPWVKGELSKLFPIKALLISCIKYIQNILTGFKKSFHLSSNPNSFILLINTANLEGYKPNHSNRTGVIF